MIEPAAMRRLGIFLCGLLALLSGGCVIYPTTTQPGITFRVHDEAGRPVEGAKVTLASSTVGMYSRDVGWLEVQTDSNGQILIPRKIGLQLVILAPDGASFYDWAWCVEKPGYAPVIRNDLMKYGVRKIEEVVLKRAGPPWEATWYKPSRKFVAGPMGQKKSD